MHLLAAVFCLGTSAYYHLTSILSEKWYDRMSRLDYGGIAILIMGSSYPPNWYLFSCREVVPYRVFFLGLITISSIICFFVTLLDFFAKPKYRAVRGILFVVLGLSAGIPMGYVDHLRRLPE